MPVSSVLFVTLGKSETYKCLSTRTVLVRYVGCYEYVYCTVNHNKNSTVRAIVNLSSFI